MTSITVALVVLAAGWIFARLWLRTRYMALKEAGHPQYFAAAVAGVFLLLLGASVHAWAVATFPWYLELDGRFLSVLPQGDDTSGGMGRAALVQFASCATWALGLAWVLPWLLNLPLLANARLLRATMKRAGTLDAIEHISSHSLDCGIPLLITLKNKKVYIGTPVALSTLDIERKWFVLVPLLSGYRSDTLKLELPVNYGGVYQNIFRDTPEEAARLINEFRVVIAFAEIVSIQTFNISTYYERFKREHPIGGAVSEEDEAEAEVNEEAATADVSLDAAVEEVQASWAAGVEDLTQKSGNGFSEDERNRLRAYYAYLVLVAGSLVALPYSLLVAIGLAFISGLCAVAASQSKPFNTAADE